MGGLEAIAHYDLQEKRNLADYLKIKDNVYVSVYEGFSLKQYTDIRQFICKQRHPQPSKNCEGLVNVANVILDQGFLKLKTTMTTSSPHVRHYKASLARRKLLQMPLACIGVGRMEQGTYCLYLVEKQNLVDYSIFQTLLENAALKPGVKEMSISKEEMSNILYLAETESQRELLKYVVVKATGLSNTKAKSFYGLSNVKERKEKVESALEKAISIRQSIEKIARLKDRALLT